MLGHLFFIVYVNDLATDVKCRFSVKLFADDTLLLFTVVEDTSSAASDMRQNLELDNRWAYG